MIKDFDKQNIIIFGGSNGVGLELAKYLLKSNAKIILICKSQKNVNSAKKYLGKKKYKILINDCYEDNFENIHNTCKNFFKNKIDHLVSFLGTGKVKFGIPKDILIWREVFEKNFFVNVKVFLDFKKYFKKKDYSSSIIFTSAIAGLEKVRAPITYSIAKTTLIAFTNHLAQEMLSEKIRVLSISPGNIKFKKGRWEEIIKKNKKGVDKFINKNVGMKRFGTAKEIAYLYYVLMSKNNSFMTGSNIIADGLQLKKII